MCVMSIPYFIPLLSVWTLFVNKIGGFIVQRDFVTSACLGFILHPQVDIKDKLLCMFVPLFFFFLLVICSLLKGKSTLFYCYSFAFMLPWLYD